ncbi:hypothetical protein CDD82_5529 [Ophiocordyceps australis]|uniref:CID domain-containing protein n=1 Tax=Ophiocordyceps australis TaxID=1399860 RepID=A0A2C5Z2D7_9HYPO|nr:hypothetical protein CDD82_5529 [Ophiocordyceps australis]
MDPPKAPEGFPNIAAKLSQPVMQSSFEKQKAHKEAKRKRDEADAQVVLEKFVEDFGGSQDSDDGPDTNRRLGSRMPRPPRRDLGAPSGFNSDRRHFAASGMKKSGPGTLGPITNSFNNKRSYHDFTADSRDKYDGPPRKDMRSGPVSVSDALRNASDDEMEDVERVAAERAEMRAAAKPQLKLSNMPPGTTQAAIKALLPDALTVDAVKIDPPLGPGDAAKRCTNAVVTLSRESTGSAIETAVTALNNRYLGFGFYLSASRHLSSAVLHPATAPSSSAFTTQPFGAKAVEKPKSNFKRVGQHRGYAPPATYNHVGNSAVRPDHFYVPVIPCDDIRTLRQIHTVVENVLKYGAAYEALLMSRPEVQREEKWAWLWDSRSPGGIWYRWRLWELTTEYKVDPRKEPFVYLFEDSPPWQVPDRLPFEYVTELDELASDADYDSEDDDDVEANGSRGEMDKTFMAPLDKGKLVHLLARLPTALSKLRKGDVARVTAFVLTHADRGPREAVELLLHNICKPLAFTGANLDKHGSPKELRQGLGAEEPVTNDADMSASSLIGLYIVSDILSAAVASTIRHAWRFRGLFDKGLKEYQIFDFLGQIPVKNGWGRMRAENWKRSINLVLHLWEGWCVFQGKTMDTFKTLFENPPSLKTAAKNDSDMSDKSKWKPMETKAANQVEQPMDMEVATDGTKAESAVRDDAEGEPIDDDDVMGEPIDDDQVLGSVMTEEEEGEFK